MTELQSQLWDEYGEALEDLDMDLIKSVQDVKKYYRVEACSKCGLSLLILKTNENDSFICAVCIFESPGLEKYNDIKVEFK